MNILYLKSNMILFNTLNDQTAQHRMKARFVILKQIRTFETLNIITEEGQVVQLGIKSKNKTTSTKGNYILKTRQMYIGLKQCANGFEVEVVKLIVLNEKNSIVA